MKHSLLFASAPLLTVACAACNNVHGMGQDRQEASEKNHDVVEKK